ncbi:MULTISPECIES: MbtH family protein [unclassified Streptomyces]|uniref:MbtH family protein n=1 Tax=unclassified Streptomyces TaxID=2593676 RepID=UPI0011E7FF1B|nr:MbtH family protein [Streptomyces sp. sk2.1]TXS71648.1 MbtH family protein [Streptomyces sp. sk2.1]
MTNPFDDEQASFRVLRNEEGQYSLWPEFAELPGGWTPVFGPQERSSCVAYVEEHWSDMRPLSLVRAMEGR